MAIWIPYFELDCKKCSDGQKALYGCEKESTVGDWWDVGEFKLNRCPIKIVDCRVYEYIRAYNRYEKGYLPDDGGWKDQSAKFNDAIDIIEKQTAIIANKKQKSVKR